MPSPVVVRRGRAAAPLLLVAAALAAPVAGAADPARGPSPGGEEVVLRTRLHDAARAGRWAEVVEAFAALRARGLGADPRLLLRYAEAQAALGDVAAATAAAEAVVEGAPADARALSLLARLRHAAGRADEARELLVRAARGGGHVLRDLAAAAPAPLARLLEEPAFVLRVMTAAQGTDLAAVRRDPFASPVDDAPPPPELPPPSAERLLLEAEVDALLERIAALAEGPPDVARFGAALRELAALLTRWQALGAEVARDRLEARRARFERLREVHDGLRVQVALAEANGLLRALAQALADDAPDEALAVHGRALDLAARLEADALPAIARLGEALRLRADPLGRRARTLSRIARLRLEVTGVVLPPPAEGPRRAIVDDAIVAEGALVELHDGAAVRVVAIGRSAVRFALDDVEFVRALRLPR